MSDSIWISPFIEHCLSSYQTEENLRPDRSLKWEDDGSNLRFPSSVQHGALINSWNEGDGRPKAILTDSDTQIEAILSGESLIEYGRAFPREPLSNDGCRGYLIQLGKFQLVYEYSTGKPNVHLYVERFNIIWGRGKTRSPPTGKMIRNKRPLVLLMQKVYGEIKSRESQESQGKTRSKEEIGSEGSVGAILATQAINGHAYASTQAHFMSQLPSHLSAVSEPGHDPVHDAILSQNNSRPETPEMPRPSREISTGTHLLNQRSVTTAAGHSRGASSVSATSNKPPSSREVQRSTNAPQNNTPPVEVDTSSGLAGSQLSTTHPFSQDLTREGSPPASTEGDLQEKTVERRDSPYSPNKQLNSQLQASQNVTYRPRNPPADTSQSMVDPWKDMTEIRSIDVTVPADQEDILGREKSQWYPPLIGQPSVSGHVPPALLDKWNRIVLRRSRKKADSKLNSSEDDRPGDHHAPSGESPGSADGRSKSLEDGRQSRHSTPSAQSEGSEESEGSEGSEGSAISWSQSPGRAPPRCVVLPGDSSPVRAPAIPCAPQQTGPDAQVGTDPVSRDSANENRSPSKASQEQGLGTTSKSFDIVRSGQALAVAHGDGGHNSDNSSSDSEMDEIMPQPQSSSTQQGVSSQLEAEISSSGPPFPESTRQVQVAETPSTVLHKSRASKQGDLELRQTNENADISSQTNKSSSQSRILNTYASLEGDSRGEPSQGSSKSVLTTMQPDLNANSAHGVDTPISGQAPRTQGFTSQSQSGSFLPSSAPKSIESNAPIMVSTYPSQSSNAFSPNRELPPSSMLSVVEERQSPSILSSSPEIPLMSLKRLASEADADFNASPSKRSKVDQKPTIIDLEIEYDALICSRYQACINSAQSNEASRVYDRFCSLYPAYIGDFAHFVKLCSKLQAFRALGNLQRSYMWDDFIIKHLEEYPAYLGECMAKETKQLPYEEFFASSFSRPTYKSRFLTPESIDACAAQVITIDDTPAVTPPDPTTDAKTSFTSGIRDQLSNFHTHSFMAMQDPECQGTQGDNDIGSQYSIPDSEPIRAAAQEIEQEDTQQTVDNDEIMEDAEDIGAAHETASVELGDEESPRVRQVLSDDDETMDDPLGDELAETANVEPAVILKDQAERSFDAAVEADVEGEDNDDDRDDQHEPTGADTLHAQMDEDEDEVGETEPDDESEGASDIAANANAEVDGAEEAVEEVVNELVDEVAEEAVDETVSDIDFEEPDPDADDPNENWFLSLRNIYPAEPVWSDDANTPFKKWARADQNVFSVRHRRGGAHVSTDEQGVIQRMNRPRQ
ncbi:hypothetical protein BJY00DRAFT_277784 [Aspergillus carlsbadensis]|nr:hypothetical protein BJY00DRAFT_277784 [Aspergillus carlsbadensis]